ncbi:COP-coated vesicle membrane protein erv25 precursor [Trypanosoma theileri]|uniref:COP-coated vesicle membrane protein erv25 n=1 Tax=Trypanosoma theileri TaxID=67003 RepID=A0A1X0P7Z0_9TRYP|nr:COP-coated vesicle membrane protein erv25 precursor [Trypanosoma theileri]ORC92951.1 COP-coated vesicle membrane protein erv25 precursor [Trypanosoma theileri]
MSRIFPLPVRHDHPHHHRRQGHSVPQLPLLLLLLLALTFVSVPSGAVRFVLRDTTPVCFVEEVDDATRVVSGEYTRTGANTNVPATIIVSDPSGNEISNSPLAPGAHAFTAPVSNGMVGPYLICVQVAQRGWVAPQTGSDAIVLDFNADQSSRTAVKPEVPVTRQRIDGMEVFTFRDFGGQQKDMLRPAEYIHGVEKALNILDTLVEETKDEIDHLMGRFARMRRTSESTYTRIWAFGILTATVMIGVTWLQFRFLKSTLRHKKLV